MNRRIAIIIAPAALLALSGCSKEARVTWSTSIEELDYSPELWTWAGGVAQYDNDDPEFSYKRAKRGVTALADGTHLNVSVSDSGRGFFGMWRRPSTIAQGYPSLVEDPYDLAWEATWTWGDPSRESGELPRLNFYDHEDWGTTSLGEPIYFAYGLEEDGADLTYTLFTVTARGSYYEPDAEALVDSGGGGDEATSKTARPKSEDNSLEDLDYFAVSTEIFIQNAHKPHDDLDTGAWDTGYEDDDDEGGDDGGDDGDDGDDGGDDVSFLGSWASATTPDCSDQPTYFTFSDGGKGYANTPDCNGICGYTKYSYYWSGAEPTDASGNITINYYWLEGCGYDVEVDHSVSVSYSLASDGQVLNIDGLDLFPVSSTP